MSLVDPRVAAARSISAVSAGKSLERALGAYRDHPERGLIFELCYGVVRHWFSLSEQLDARLKTPLRKKDLDLYCLILVGSYQLQNSAIADHAAVNLTVEAARHLGKHWACGLVNAILRTPRESVDQSDEARFEAPSWLIQSIQRHYPDSAEKILRVNNTRAPMTLRVNRNRQTTESLAQILLNEGIPTVPGSLTNALSLVTPQAVNTIPGYSEGWFTVQDEASQRAIHLLELQPTTRVLDACAAPGIKALQLLETCDDIQLTAIDIDPTRGSYGTNESLRLGLPFELRVGDATRRDWWDGELFDSILIDAPCTGTGTLRRKPDIKVHRTLEDVVVLQRKQQDLLTNLWHMLASGGTLLYSTCSILPDENDSVIHNFLDQTTDAAAVPIDADWGHATLFGRQCLPTERGPDGFFYSRITKLQ